MALRETASDRFTLLIDQVARAIGRHGASHGDTAGAAAALRVTFEDNVRRVVQVYWTPFQVDVPDRSLGLHLEVAEPRVHWAEAYVSPTYRNWVFCFAEREDGDVQLSYYREYENPADAIKGFFDLSSWYVLTATDKTWADVVYEVDPEIDWTEHHLALGGKHVPEAVQESLKKSTILWLRWTASDGTERTMPVWFLYDNKTSKIYVLSGERQQTIPGAENLRDCTIVLRWKGRNSQVAEIPAAVRVIPLGPEFDEVAEKVAEKRLNIPGLPEDTAKRWRDECIILELTPRF